MFRRVTKSIRKDFEDMIERIPECGGGCWLWLACTDASGYGVYQVNHRIRRETRAHRISWQLYKGPIPTGMLVCHHCDVPSCVNPSHLFLGTKRDNALDMTNKGRNKFPEHIGEDNPSSKLTEAVVREIRKRRSTGEKVKTLAAFYDVAVRTIESVIYREHWKHVD